MTSQTRKYESGEEYDDEIEDEDEYKEWDKTTAEIASLASDELHETRPNRWTGSASTWAAFTERERHMWAALEGLRRGDLGAHLYNSWALRVRRGRGWGQAREGTEESDQDTRKQREWTPGRNWTAWPVPVDEVPPDGLMARDHDNDTVRREQGAWSSANLEEEVSALMLRFARERFSQRQGSKEVLDSIEMNISGSDASGESVGEENESEDQGQDQGQDESQSESESEDEDKVGVKERGLTPVPAADDDISYALLRPAARRILTQLDGTLTILHNARVAALGDASDSPESEAEEASPRKPGRPRRASPRKESRKKPEHLPREGETHREMLIRVARESKRKMPEYYGHGAHTEEEVRRRGSRRSKSRSRPTKSEENISRMGLRGWRDVMGAAALAGFPPLVLARATQRCATLFGEEMSLHTLPEQAADSQAAETTTYKPGEPLVEYFEEDDVEEELEQLRAVSRQSSVRLTSRSPDSETPASAKRRRSATPGGEQHFCPHPSCPRALLAFSRRGNLARHLQVMHGSTLQARDVDEVDSMDEMDGAVHRDGFLTSIKTRPGWRGEDLTRERTRRKGKYRARSRVGSGDESPATRSRRVSFSDTS